MARAATVVIPAHGDADGLSRLLDALDSQARHGEPLRVIVSDDGSPDPLADAIQSSSFPALEIELVRAEVPAGPGAARNRGLELVRTPWVAFVDGDEIPAPGWLRRLEEIAGDPDSWPAVEGAVDHGEEEARPLAHVGTLADGSHLSGNLAFRRDVLALVGGFDERFYDRRHGLHFREDTELFFRLEAAGVSPRRDETLLVHHPPHPRSLGTPLRHARRYYFDPLLARLHGERFRAFNRRRLVGPLSLRRARHQAAVAHVLGIGLLSGGLVTGSRAATFAGLATGAAGWAANAAALSWGRRVRARDVAPIALVALALPWVYVVWYYRGVVRFRHLPRL
ncbi:MAG TPA: glycosyltransferase [Gaiellaceae bacterium]|nr:glycosyltransferase [Gaiellaceae bacterium]